MRVLIVDVHALAASVRQWGTPPRPFVVFASILPDLGEFGRIHRFAYAKSEMIF